MTVADVEAQVANIRGLTGDPEEAHCKEDSLWEAVLKAIRDGETDDPAALCAAALKTLEIDFERWFASLREAAEPFWETADTHGPGPAPVLASLADRIEALLPPRDVP